MIRIKLTWENLVYLKLAMEHPPVGDDPASDLLYEHAFEFEGYFERLIQQARNNYNVKFTSLQALAFMKIWKGRQLPGVFLAQTVILKVIGDIDKKSKQPKYLR